MRVRVRVRTCACVGLCSRAYECACAFLLLLDRTLSGNFSRSYKIRFIRNQNYNSCITLFLSNSDGNIIQIKYIQFKLNRYIGNML